MHELDCPRRPQTLFDSSEVFAPLADKPVFGSPEQIEFFEPFTRNFRYPERQVEITIDNFFGKGLSIYKPRMRALLDAFDIRDKTAKIHFFAIMNAGEGALRHNTKDETYVIDLSMDPDKKLFKTLGIPPYSIDALTTQSWGEYSAAQLLTYNHIFIHEILHFIYDDEENDLVEQMALGETSLIYHWSPRFAPLWPTI